MKKGKRLEVVSARTVQMFAVANIFGPGETPEISVFPMDAKNLEMYMEYKVGLKERKRKKGQINYRQAMTVIVETSDVYRYLYPLKNQFGLTAEGLLVLGRELEKFKPAKIPLDVWVDQII